MKRIRTRIACLLSITSLSLALATGCPAPNGTTGTTGGIPEEVVRHNILGTAYLGQQKWSEAEQAFLQAVELRDSDPLLLNNVAVALIQQSRLDEAESYLRRAVEADAEHAYAHYNLGLMEKNRGSFHEAAVHFEAVAKQDPEDLVTQYNLGIVLSRVGRDDDAETAFRNALAKNPTHVSTLYGLGRFLLQKGQAEEGERMIALSQEIRARSGLDEAIGTQYGEQGAYAMGVDYPGGSLAAPAPIEVAFESAASSDAGEVHDTTPIRLHPAGDPALVAATGSGLLLLSADGFSDSALPAPPTGARILALAGGDFQNDGTVDLAALFLDDAGLTAAVLVQDEQGGFSWADGSVDGPAARGPVTSAADLAAVDRDHDGDLDLFWCWTGADGAGCTLATNDSAGSFDARDSSEHGFTLDGASGGVQVAFSDIDNDRDIDLLAAGPWGVRLFTNQRDGSFEEISDKAGLGGLAASSFTVVDLNKDAWMDLLLAGGDGPRLLVNAKGRFESPASLGDHGGGTERLVVVDFDNDGFLDVARATDGGPPSLLRNAGADGWGEQARALPGAAGATPLAALDTDGDGDPDLVTLDGTTLTLLANEGGNANGWIKIDPKGVNDNRFGIGSKVEILAGALRQKFEIDQPVPLLVGLGERADVQSVRFLWPAGVLQDEVEQPAGSATLITQLDRKGTSCPLLYAWRDGGWRFVTDFLGGSAIGYQKAPGVFSVPDTDEYVRVDGGLEEHEGMLRLRLNNQLEEVIWFDQVELVVVDHPAGSEVYPNERLMPAPPFPEFRLFASDDIRPLASARGIEDGRDLSPALRELDRRFVDNFELLPFKGYAERHTVELDLGRFERGQRVVLLLDGWIDYADSTSNVAALQAGAKLIPPRLTVADGRGGWIEPDHLMGFPAGLPKTMAVELTGLFPAADHRVRIETSMRIYWDRARVLLGGDDRQLLVQRLAPRSAELRHGGFPQETSPDGRKPRGYDPRRVIEQAGWKAHVGAYTAFGEVTPLISTIDDRFVTTRNGDEIELRFPAPDPPRDGWERTYLLYADGFGKDMDPNSAANNEVGPIPFHGMPIYPYGDDVVPPHPDATAHGATRRVLHSERGLPGAVPQVLASRTPE